MRPIADESPDAAEPGTAGQDAVGFVLAGGLSSRMAADKALQPFRWFLNVNTPEDLRRAERLHSGFGGATAFAHNSNFASDSGFTAPVG